MLTILHELGLHRRPDGSLDTGAFKIVYVAPMKALVAEMVGNFTKRLGDAYGLSVRELTGAAGAGAWSGARHRVRRACLPAGMAVAQHGSPRRSLCTQHSACCASLPSPVATPTLTD